MTDQGSLPATSTNRAPETEEPIPNPGMPVHEWRPTDVDPKAEKRAERQVALLFTSSMVMSVLFVVAYFTLDVGEDPTIVAGLGASNVALGVTLGLALLCIGIGVIHWSRKLMGDHEIAEDRHPARSPDEDREAVVEELRMGAEESGIARRPLVRNSLLGALAMIGIPAIVALRDIGPTPTQLVKEAAEDPLLKHAVGLKQTIWSKGMRVVRDVVGTPIHVSEVEIGDLINAEPAILFKEKNGEYLVSGADRQVAKSKAAVILHRMDPDEITPWKGRENWSVEGIVCFSKICTHVGCPISLNEQQTHHLLCPCHQSTFDLADNGRVVFGPAARPLPQLPLKIDDEGYLVAQSDFTEPVGPSFWERDKT